MTGAQRTSLTDPSNMWSLLSRPITWFIFTNVLSLSSPFKEATRCQVSTTSSHGTPVPTRPQLRPGLDRPPEPELGLQASHGQARPAPGAPGVQAPSPSPPCLSRPRRGCHSPLSASKRPQARQEPQKEPRPAGSWEEEEGRSGHPGAAATKAAMKTLAPSPRLAKCKTRSQSLARLCHLIHPDPRQCP